MPSNLFFELNDEKKQNILDISRIEFVENGYELASTNRIIKAAKIAKGSLFKYFNSKEELYLDIIDISINNMIRDTSNEYANLPDDLFEMILRCSEIEFNWYIKNKYEYIIIRNAFRKDNPLYKKLINKYGRSSEEMFFTLLDGVNTDNFSAEPDMILNTLKWFLNSFNEEFLSELEEGFSCDKVKKEYLIKLRSYLELLKIGLLTKDQ